MSEFLQDRFASGLSSSTFNVYMAAIAAYHSPVGDQSIGRNLLVTRFLRGIRRLRPPVCPIMPTWDLAVVLEALSKAQFEPLEEVPLRFLTVKTVFLLAISSLKRVGDLQALSVVPSCLEFAPGMARVFLYPRPRYVPKVPSVVPRPVILQAFFPPPFWDADQEKLNCVCQVWALDIYVHRAALWRKSDQLFVCHGPYKKCIPANKQTVSRWIVDAITTAYESSDLPSPLGVRAHSTRSMAASKAFSSGVSMHNICNDGPPLWPFSGSKALTLRPLLAPQFFLPRFVPYTLGRDLSVWWRGQCRSQSVSTQLEVPERERSRLRM